MSDTRKLTPVEEAYRDKEHALDLLTRIRMARSAFDTKPSDMDDEVDFRFEAVKGMLDIAAADAFHMSQLWTDEYEYLRQAQEKGE